MSDEESPPAEKPPESRLFELIWPGGLAAQAVYAAARLNLADHLADGPKTAGELARATNAHPPSLERLLRALTSLGLLSQEADGRFRSTAVGETLESRRPGSVHPSAVFLGSPFLWNAWAGLYDNVMTGKTAFETVFGKPFYQHVADNAEDGAIFDTAMSSGSARAVDAVVEAYDFSRFETIVDVGGGQGKLLEGILAAHPGVKGVLFDLPAVVAGAAALRQGPVADRCEIEGGDAFDSVPAGADAYLLKTVIHGFDDESAVRLLGRCREAIRDDGRLLLLEVVLRPSNEPDPQKALMDLMMLTLVPGRERTEEEFEALLRRADFTLLQVFATSGGGSVIEARPGS